MNNVVSFMDYYHNKRIMLLAMTCHNVYCSYISDKPLIRIAI
jgi:hypothetical protein